MLVHAEQTPTVAGTDYELYIRHQTHGDMSLPIRLGPIMLSVILLTTGSMCKGLCNIQQT